MRARDTGPRRSLRLLALPALLLTALLVVPALASAATVEVRVVDFAFIGPDGEGQPIRIDPGDTVLFVSEGRVCHTVSRGEGAIGACEAPNRTDAADFDFVLQPDMQARVTFETVEVVRFYCRPHVTFVPPMAGVIVVGDAPFNQTPQVHEPALLNLSQLVLVGLLALVGVFVGAEFYWSSTRRPVPLGAGAAAAPTAEPHEPGEVHSSLWPLVVAGGATVFLAGLLFPELRGVGLLLLLGGVVAWALEDMRDLKARANAGLLGDGLTSDRYFGVLILIIAEVMLFGVLFAFYFWASGYEAPWPPAYVEPFDIVFVSANTAVLLGSGAAGHFALEALSAGKRRQYRVLMVTTVAMGTVFLLGQAIEYATASFSWTSGAYGTAFFALTGTHGAHVAVGIIALASLLLVDFASASKPRPSAVSAAMLYWHFVDAVWVGLFAVVYLRVV